MLIKTKDIIFIEYNEFTMNKIDLSSTNSVIDVHCHLGGVLLGNILNGSYPYSQDPLDLIRKMQANKIDYSICFPFPLNGEFGLTYDLFNQLLLQESQKFGDNKLLPFMGISLDDNLQTQLQSIDSLRSKYNIYGFKIYPPNDKYSINDKAVESILSEYVEKYNLPLIFHTAFSGNGNPLNILDFAKHHPNIRLVLAHAARFNENAFQEIKTLENVYLDCSPLNLLCALMRKYCEKHTCAFDRSLFFEPNKTFMELYKLFPDKLVWGSDAPYNYSTNFQEDEWTEYNQSYSYEENAAFIFTLDEKIREKVAHKNTLNFLFGVDI